MSSFAAGLAATRRREVRRFFVFSAFAHAALAWALAMETGGAIVAPRGVIAVDLVALAPAPRSTAPAAPAPPKLRPKPPVPEKIVLPKQPRALPPTPAQPEVQARPKLPEPRIPEPVRPEPVQEEYTDIMDQLRTELGESSPANVARAAPAIGSPTGSARPISPEVAAWMRKAKIHVRRNWVVPPGFRTQQLETHVMVNLGADGTVQGEPRVVRRSGNPWYDEGVVRAIQKASPLPAPPEADEWPFVFVPEDSY